MAATQWTTAVESVRFDEQGRLLVCLDSGWRVEGGTGQLVALSARWTLTGQSAPLEPLAYLDFATASAPPAALYLMTSVRGTRWEVHFFDGSLIAEACDLEALGTAAEMMVDDPDTMLASYRRAFGRSLPESALVSASDDNKQNV